jgi:hypothetical protein
LFGHITVMCITPISSAFQVTADNQSTSAWEGSAR